MERLDLPTLKICTSCRIEKPINDFHRRLDSYAPKCKECVREYNILYRAQNQEELHAKDRARSGRQKLNPKRNEYSRAWRARNKGHTSPTTGLPYGVKTKEAASAQEQVHRAIKRGELTRPIACTRCGRTDQRIEASHDDYLKPLEVIWLCVSCHRTKDSRGNSKGGWVKF